jgi:hypothetical protein
VLILNTTVTGGLSSYEAIESTNLGLTPDVVDSTTWAGMSTADFATYRAIILGDPTCETDVSTYAGAAVTNALTWGPAVT